MKNMLDVCLFVVLLAMAASSHAEIINQVPHNVVCVASGTGSGTCNIIFPAGTIASCPNNTHVIFNPESGTLGKQIYAMTLFAIAVGKALHISLLPGCDATGRAMIDWIKV